MAEVLLEVKDLVTVFASPEGEQPAVSNVSFSLHRGETIGIVGESGSGKSVTSLTIMRLFPSPRGRIRSGSIVLHDKRGSDFQIVSASREEMQALRGNRIAMIFQEPMTALNPVMTCGEQVMEGLLHHKNFSREEAREKTLQLFSEVSLPDPSAIFLRYPHQISGGQKQRVMIAMALSCEPDVIIADEPTTALDVTVQKTILELLIELQKKRGLGLIFITHDLGVIAEVADQVLVMYKGKVVEQGPVLDVFATPQHPYTKGLLACKPPLNRRPVRLPVVSDYMSVDPEGNFSEKLFVPAETEFEPTNDARPVLLEVNDLSIWYPSKKTFFGTTIDYFKAVRNVSFYVREGETLGLVGESGCGKSTLGRALIRLAPVRSGQVKYRGVNLLDLNEKDFHPYRRKIQIIFQDPYASLNPRITVGESIAEPIRVHGLTGGRNVRDMVEEMLLKVGLDRSHYNRFPHEFSGGQRQRICIARALVLRPEFLICDESVSALDVSVQAQVLNLLNDLKRELSFTCIFISHDLSVVKYMSDRIMVMQKGSIVEHGDPRRIYESPAQEYTKKLIDAIPDSSLEHIREVQKRRQKW